MATPRRRWTLLGLFLACGLFAAFAAPAAAADGPFTFKDTAGQCLDVLFGGRMVARYMYAHDASTKERRLETYKPYLHVFDAEGKSPITKGTGGLFTHHRGIFIGWNKITFEGRLYDRWHMPDGEQVHQKFTDEKAGPDRAAFTSLVYWNDADGKPIIEEERTTTFHAAAAPAIALIDFTTRLSAPRGDVLLKGDPEHAGIQYRPADEVTKPVRYVFPRDGVDPTKDKDLAWVAEQYVLGGKIYSVQQMNHPENPKGTLYSAYRDYGRFGAFFETEIKKGESLRLRYRFWVAAGEMPSRDVLQRQSDAFAAAPAPAAPK
ncbi:MAG: PmoA family protein [Planctomycetes bacterium]|nr:PmoA family protein [Planctomycetota bacterium]